MKRGAHPREVVTVAFSRLFVATAGAAVLVRLVRHNLFFDETVHMHILWAVSAGLRPYADFFFASPVLAHSILSPFFGLLPEGGYLLPLLRLLSIGFSALVACLLWRHGRRVGGSGIYGVVPFLLVVATPEMGRFAVEFSPDHLAMAAAVGAILLYFEEGVRPSRVGWAAALCVLSVSLNPKYAIPLALGGAGYLASSILRERDWRSPVGWGLLGCAAAFCVQWGILASRGVSMGDALRWGFVFPAQYHTTVVGQANDATLGWQVRQFLLDNPLIGIFLAPGLAGWVVRAWRRGSVRDSLGPAGILAGTAFFSFSTLSNLEQYLFPVIVILCCFAPYGPGLLSCLTRGGKGGDAAGEEARRGWLAVAWTAAALVMALLLLLDSAGVVTRTQRSHYFRKEIDPDRSENILQAADRIGAILEAVPPGERVIGLWFHNPIFRRDLTKIHCDELGGFAPFLPAGDPVRAWFSPEALISALEAFPPAYVGTFQLKTNYPPDWLEILIRFLEKNADLYQGIPTRHGGVFVRKDLYTPELGRRLE